MQSPSSIVSKTRFSGSALVISPRMTRSPNTSSSSRNFSRSKERPSCANSARPGRIVSFSGAVSVSPLAELIRSRRSLRRQPVRMYCESARFPNLYSTVVSGIWRGNCLCRPLNGPENRRDPIPAQCLRSRAVSQGLRTQSWCQTPKHRPGRLTLFPPMMTRSRLPAATGISGGLGSTKSGR